ncbi:MAG: hypothetical protein JWM97_920 [Phycisphaerales bacterium]|nr:hypothetical protein [Phycisphaerales bacterium]
MEKDRPSSVLFLVAVTKLLKAALLVAVAAGAHKLLHHDAEEVIRHWAHAVRVGPASHWLDAAIARVTGMSDRRLEVISIATLLYAALFATEGVGLLLRQRWAEYLTVVSTSLLLPLEVYELVRRWHVSKVHVSNVVVLVLNLLIVAYLAWRLWKTDKRARRRG